MQFKLVRKHFIEFFQKKAHTLVDAAPVVNKDDPTLMFTNAGMNQFKNLFLGEEVSPFKRVVDSQPCLRVSGKHNDLEEVGVDTYHHTLFEMLGNWSFGDYFKPEAIAWAWELLTEVYQIPKDRLYVTVFEGDSNDGLVADDESFQLWQQHIDAERIIWANKKDNFWEMGAMGPCGPCTEIHVDMRSDAERNAIAGKELVNKDHPAVIEIWNLVFIQFNRSHSGQLELLPEKHVDTGMGLERLTMVLQNKQSTYDTDVFTPIIEAIEKKAQIKYGEAKQTDIAIRVIADHIRAITMVIADGQIPSNQKAGYVIRRILRRAVRYGYTYLGFEQPFLYEIVGILSEQFADFKPNIQQQLDFIQRIIHEEELLFLKTLSTGIQRLEQVAKSMYEGSSIDGETVFELYDTYGFPPDLTALIAQEKGLTIDQKGFDEAMRVQKGRSQQDAEADTSDWHIVRQQEHGSSFIGYEKLVATSKLIKYRTITEKGEKKYQLVFEQTPFYPEGGGQVGDTGFIHPENFPEQKVNIIDTRKENDVIVHYTRALPTEQYLDKLFKLEVDASRRQDIARNHSATHLLHAALKAVLGDHVEQRGSLVNDKVLRFDFSHYAKLTNDELHQITFLVNKKIRANISVQVEHDVPLAEAKKRGANALFGEKYGQKVRIVTMGPTYSLELCGGTHVNYTGKIGYFKVKSTSALAAGIRRIEALTGKEAVAYTEQQFDHLQAIRKCLNDPRDLIKSMQQLVGEKKELLKKIKQLERVHIQQIKNQLLKKVTLHGQVSVFISKVDVPSHEALRQLAFTLKNETKELFLVLGSIIQNKPQLVVMISEHLLTQLSGDANWIINHISPAIEGNGGGQPFFATAGGKNVSGLDEALKVAKNYWESETQNLEY